MAASPKKKTPNPVAIAFGKTLRATREQDGRSQEALALDCDLDRTYIGLLERGINQPTLGTIFLLADELAVPAEAMVTATRDAMRSKQSSKTGKKAALRGARRK